MNHLSGFDNFRAIKKCICLAEERINRHQQKDFLKNKFLKSTKIQLLWDFLSYKQLPQSQAIIYRVGYDF